MLVERLSVFPDDVILFCVVDVSNHIHDLFFEEEACLRSLEEYRDNGYTSVRLASVNVSMLLRIFG